MDEPQSQSEDLKSGFSHMFKANMANTKVKPMCFSIHVFSDCQKVVHPSDALHKLRGIPRLDVLIQRRLSSLRLPCQHNPPLNFAEH